MKLPATNWIRNQPKEEVPVIVTQKTDIRSIVALITLIIGTLVCVTGVALQFGMFAGMIAVGVVLITFGLALGFSKD
jgi:hypothetical protein